LNNKRDLEKKPRAEKEGFTYALKRKNRFEKKTQAAHHLSKKKGVQKVEKGDGGKESRLIGN